MQVGAIGGGVGMGMPAGAPAGVTAGSSAGASAAGSAAGSTAAGSTADTASIDGKTLTGTIPAGLEMLSDVANDLNSIQILVILLLMAATQKDGEDQKSGGGAVLGFLAGLALAGQIGQSIGFDMQGQIPQTSPAGQVGANLNVTA